MVSAAPENFAEWPELATLDTALNESDEPLAHFQNALKAGDERLAERFRAAEPVEELVRDRGLLVDGLLLRAWRRHIGDALGELALIAVGGYGRGELHPGSDIDFMVLVPDPEPGGDWKASVESFLTFLWDLGLEVGHSVRSVGECAAEAEADITVATSLMESRLLHGERELFDAMRAATGPERIWPSRAFFEAKVAEQIARYHRYDDTGYNLEPNVKGSPGGLRDIQMIGWVAKRHFGADSFRQLIAEEFLTTHEYNSLQEGQRFLWRIRFGLHVIAGRREDRLLFDHQRRLAQDFGFQDLPHTLAVEQLMQRYYRVVMRLSRLNEMLLQLFREAILGDDAPVTIQINERFQAINGNLDAIDDSVFVRTPSALLEVFQLILRNEEVNGVTARTIRSIRRHRDDIDERFRSDPENYERFMEILRAEHGVTHELRRMNRYGILGRFIPAFGHIVGRMQYDLFHVYTVDAHTLFVISNLRRFALSRFDDEYPYCSKIMQSLPKPELAYLAALFHDIAKGRGGDHSDLGAIDAELFCTRAGLSRYDASLVAWLVKQHLALSLTAQKKDINDPQIINQFAAGVGDQLHLDYLYVLTVADVRATNPKLWNSWKAQLFRQLYRHTRRTLSRGLENPIDKEELVRENLEGARRLIHDAGISDRARDEALRMLGEDYFLRHSATEIAWHTAELVKAGSDPQALVAVRSEGKGGGATVMVYTPRAGDSFAQATAVLDEMGLNIVDARITATANDCHLDTYRVMNAAGATLTDDSRLAKIETTLGAALRGDSGPPRVTRTASRAVRHFTTPTVVEFVIDLANRRTIMELTAADRPGLLSEVGRAFRVAKVVVRTAKITTVGERAEDVFYLTDAEGRPLSDDICGELHRALMKRIGQG